MSIKRLTLYFVFTGTPSPSGVYGAPVDPDDFVRCYLLFNVFPEWQPRLADVCDISPEWEPFVLGRYDHALRAQGSIWVVARS